MSKIFQNKNILQKIAIVLLITLMCYFIIPTYSFAGWGGDMLKLLTQLFAALGDAVMGAMNKWMLGTDKMISSVMLSKDSPSITTPGAALYAGSEEVDITLHQNREEEEIEGGLLDEADEWQVPNLLYSPEAIFSNKIAALDVNFLRPSSYKDVQTGQYVDAEARSTTDSESHAKSAAGMLKETIGSWYVAFRNIAIVALLTVLVYIGIRILISSTSSDKAKYKEGLKDWLVALCLVFVLHFIMSGILMITDQVTTLFDDSANGIIVEVDDGTPPIKESLMGVARLRVQSSNEGMAIIFCIIYLVLVVYTIVFTVVYLKRFLYMAFLTMIAPLVAITYPIDKLGDGKAQAFNMWFKEYTMNAILQPLHLILYTTLITSAQELVKENFIYALVAIGFLIPAEKFVKKMFKLDRAETPGTLGGFAAGALTMKGLNNMSKIKPPLSKGNDGGQNNKIRTARGNDETPLTGKSKYDGLNTVSFGNRDTSTGIGDGIGSGAVDTARESSIMTGGSINDGSENEFNNQHNDNNANDSNNDQLGAVETSDGRSHLIPGYDINDYTGTPGFKDSVKNVANSVKNSPLTRTAIRGVKSMGKTVWRNKAGIIGKALRMGTTATLGAMGAGVGLAAGIATGDVSKAFSYMGAGLASGAMIGKNTANGVYALGKGVVGGVKNVTGNISNAYQEEALGYAKADEIRQAKIDEKAKKAFMNNKEQLAEAKKTQIKLSKEGQNIDIKDIMQSRYDYVAAGIKDNEEIRRAQLAEARSGGINGATHGDYVSISQEADRLGINARTFSNTKKYNEFHDTLSSALGGEAGGDRAMSIIAEIKGAEKYNHAQQASRRRQRNNG